MRPTKSAIDSVPTSRRRLRINWLSNEPYGCSPVNEGVMKRQLIATALTWFLVVPNTLPVASENAIQWSNAERFDTRQDCESARRSEQLEARSDLNSGTQRSLGSADPLTPQMRAVAVRWLQAKCAESSERSPQTQVAPGPANAKRNELQESGSPASTGKADKNSATSAADSLGRSWCGRQPQGQ